MSKQVELGGQRLGAGNKIEVNLHNYDRASFNLSKTFRTSMSCGTLVPFYCNVGLNGDTFDINLRHLIKTLPTVGPLMGNFKVQMDFFEIPFRLYNGILHNNMLGIATQMSDVKIPKVEMKQKFYPAWKINKTYEQVNPSSLMAYCGVRGYGSIEGVGNGGEMIREFNALPLLAYLDIFKNYYSNKQEKYCYQISTTEAQLLGNFKSIALFKRNTNDDVVTFSPTTEEDYASVAGDYYFTTNFTFNPNDIVSGKKAELVFYFTSREDIDNFLSDYLNNNYGITISKDGGANNKLFLKEVFPTYEKQEVPIYNTPIYPEDKRYILRLFFDENWELRSYYNYNYGTMTLDGVLGIKGIQNIGNSNQRNVTSLVPIELEEFDKIREEILSKIKNQLGTTLFINKNDFLKFKSIQNIVGNVVSGNNKARYAQNGLFVKTYLSDIFNNWLNTEVIEGANGIAEITKVSTADGGFTIDALNLAQKVYNLLNRIAVSGGTYDDWQEVVWDVEVTRKCESPMYMGGASCEIQFETLTSTAESGSNPQGTLAGKGFTDNMKGGNIVISVKEPSLIMGIVSITPRIDYTQGNRWYMTDIDTYDDLHMPALDGIGFQDLMTEKLCATDVYLEDKGAGVWAKAVEQNAVGKQPAWIDWQTDFGECFGDFAYPKKAQYMTLSRNYSTDIKGHLEDITTYIDPQKYNYAFADAALEAQNFWVQIACDITARRKMSAKIIPNI